MEEPITPSPRPCATPHSAPSAWLKYDPGVEPPAQDDAEPQPAEAAAVSPERQRREDIDAFVSAYERVAPEGQRRDGWTPFLRKLFLQVVADTGRVSLACAYTQMSRQSAYALADRDRVFAAGWNAAAHFARRPLADDLYEKGVDGITETVTRSDGATVTRHRYDSRLSIAVLNRLDKRCDRAEELGSKHLAAVRNWDEYLTLVGKGDDQAAEALLDRPVPSGAEGAQDRQDCQLPERAFPIPPPDPPGCDPSENCWKAGSAEDLHPDRPNAIAEGTWMTTFPPPPGFDGYQNIPWDGDNWYERTCTPDEAELLDVHAAAMLAQEQAALTAHAEAERDRFFSKLRVEIGTGPTSSFPRKREPSDTIPPSSFPRTREPSDTIPPPSFPRTREPSDTIPLPSFPRTREPSDTIPLPSFPRTREPS